MARSLMWMTVVSLVFAGVAGASVKQGDTELDLLGGFTTQNGEPGGADFESWFLSAAIGYFLTDNIQVQGAAMGAWTGTDVDVSTVAARSPFNDPTVPDVSVDIDTYGLGGRAKYHFMPTNLWVPYIGAQLMWVSADIDIGGLNYPAGTTGAAVVREIEGSRDGTMWGPLAGLRYELNENSDFYVEYQYQIWEGDVGDFLDDGHTLLVGIIHQFK